MSEKWLNYFGIKKLPGWTEEKIAQDVERRTIEALQFALKNGKIRDNWPCQGGCHEKDGRSYPIYGYSIAYRGINHDIPYGIQRDLIGLCRDCIEEALK